MLYRRYIIRARPGEKPKISRERRFFIRQVHQVRIPGQARLGNFPQYALVKLLFTIYLFAIYYFAVAFADFLIRILPMKIKTEVYFNLRKHMLSIRVNGKVVAHAPAITLDNPTFHVSEAGRQRVLKNKRKNVHAWVRGDWDNYLRTAISQVIPENSVEVTYNPYKYSTFVLAKDGSPIKTARYVAINGKKIYAQL